MTLSLIRSGPAANWAGCTFRLGDSVRRARVNPTPARDGVGLPRLCGPPAGPHHDIVVPTVLVVDDSPQFREVAAALLAERGIELLAAAADGDQALDAVVPVCPDGVLLDINLPGANGFAVAAALAAVCPTARIVLTSANVGDVPAQVLAGCAAIAFVPKEELVRADLDALFRPADR